MNDENTPKNAQAGFGYTRAQQMARLTEKGKPKPPKEVRRAQGRQYRRLIQASVSRPAPEAEPEQEAMPVWAGFRAYPGRLFGGRPCRVRLLAGDGESGPVEFHAARVYGYALPPNRIVLVLDVDGAERDSAGERDAARDPDVHADQGTELDAGPDASSAHGDTSDIPFRNPGANVDFYSDASGLNPIYSPATRPGGFWFPRNAGGGSETP